MTFDERRYRSQSDECMVPFNGKVVSARLACDRNFQQDLQFVLCCSDEGKDGFTSVSIVALVNDNNID